MIGHTAKTSGCFHVQKHRCKKIKKHKYMYMCIYSLACETFSGRGVRLMCRYPAAPEEGRGQQAVCLCLCLTANQSKSRREERGRDLADLWLLRNSWFTFQLNVALPRSPHACVPAWLTGDTVPLDKSSCSTETHPAIIFSGNIPSDDP